jgi:hypothetical protein
MVDQSATNITADSNTPNNNATPPAQNQNQDQTQQNQQTQQQPQQPSGGWGTHRKVARRGCRTLWVWFIKGAVFDSS